MKNPEDIIMEMNQWNESVAIAIKNLWTSIKDLEKRIDKLERLKRTK